MEWRSGIVTILVCIVTFEIQYLTAVNLQACETTNSLSSFTPCPNFGAHNSTAPTTTECEWGETEPISTTSDTNIPVESKDSFLVQTETPFFHEEEMTANEERYLSLEKWRDRVYSDIEREKKKDDKCFEQESLETKPMTQVDSSLSLEENVPQWEIPQDLISSEDSSVHNLSGAENDAYDIVENYSNNSGFPMESIPKEMGGDTLQDGEVFGHSANCNFVYTNQTQLCRVSNEKWTINLWFVKLLQLVNRFGGAFLRKFRYEPSETVSQDGFNFASVDAGARILAANKGSTGAKNILHEDRDKYMLSPCKHNRWVVIELSEEILLKRVQVANFEYFSSFPENLVLLGSQRFPTEKWILLQVAPFNQSRDIQYFELKDDAFIRYLKILFVGVQGREFFCTISLVRVFGKRLVDDWKEALEQSNRDRHVAAEVIAGASLKKTSLVSNDTGLDGRNSLISNSSQLSAIESSGNKSCNDSSCSSKVRLSGFSFLPENLKKEHNDNFQNISAFSEAVEESIFRQLTRMLRQLELNQTLVSQYVELHLAEYAASLSDAKREAMAAKTESEILEQRLRKLEETMTRVKLMGLFGWIWSLFIYSIGVVSAMAFHQYCNEDILNFLRKTALQKVYRIVHSQLKALWNRLMEKQPLHYVMKQNVNNYSSKQTLVRESRSKSTGNLFSIGM